MSEGINEETNWEFINKIDEAIFLIVIDLNNFLHSLSN